MTTHKTPKNYDIWYGPVQRQNLPHLFVVDEQTGLKVRPTQQVERDGASGVILGPSMESLLQV
eukprot:scaffold376_cov156-Amphora_coffeaeformis.AAC.6